VRTFETTISTQFAVPTWMWQGARAGAEALQIERLRAHGARYGFITPAKLLSIHPT